jgi:LysR family transcriptional regulator, low CO2-responsive transcriptional regulator
VIPLDRVEAFIAFAETCSFTAAAKRVHLSQPAMFAQVQRLQEQLGVVVYRRQGRSLQLTKEGEQALAFARELRERVTGFEASLRRETTNAPVVLAAGRGSYLYLLGAALRRFRRSSFTLEARVAGREQAVQEVRRGRAHIAVAAAVGMLPSDLVAARVREVGSVVAFGAGHRFTRRRRLRLGDLDGESMVAAPAGRAQRATVEKALRDAGVACPIVIEADGWDLLLHFVALGLGIAIVNDCCALPRGVKARPLVGMETTEYVMVTRPPLLHPGAQMLAAAIAEP